MNGHRKIPFRTIEQLRACIHMLDRSTPEINGGLNANAGVLASGDPFQYNLNGLVRVGYDLSTKGRVKDLRF
jgi:hypothetical protein